MKTKTVSIRLRPAEHAVLEQSALKAKLSIGQFVAQTALHAVGYDPIAQDELAAALMRLTTLP